MKPIDGDKLVAALRKLKEENMSRGNKDISYVLGYAAQVASSQKPLTREELEAFLADK